MKLPVVLGGMDHRSIGMDRLHLVAPRFSLVSVGNHMMFAGKVCGKLRNSPSDTLLISGGIGSETNFGEFFNDSYYQRHLIVSYIVIWY